MNWNKGDLAICINDDWPDISETGCILPVSAPKKGCVYSVNHLEENVKGVLMLGFIEFPIHCWEQSFFDKYEERIAETYKQTNECPLNVTF